MESIKVDVKESPIHGKGVFAGQTIMAEAYIGDYEGPITIENSTYVLWVDRDGEEIGVRGENDLKYLNHSSTPNAEFDDVKLYTLTTIKPGQEITIHYGADWDDQP